MATRPLTTCALHVPAGYELRTEITLLEPSTTLQPTLLAQPASPLPRANLVLAQRSSSQTPDELLRELVDEVRRSLPGARLEPVREVRFDDGVGGKSLMLSFEAGAGLSVLQEHTFRVDAQVASQFTATVDAAHPKKLEGLRAMVASFTP